MDKTRAHVIISGLVQGVFFRYETRMRAQSLGLTGWAMNRSDGRVEAVFEGNKDALETIVRWCHRGPSGAVVDNVDVEWGNYTGEFNGFSVKYY